MLKYLIVAFAALVQSGVAQMSGAHTEVQRLYDGGFYDKVIETADSLLQQNLTKAELATVHKLKAFAYVALDEKGKAKDEFKIVLLLEPSVRLDPNLVSPKIIEVFELAKSEMPVESPAPTPLPAFAPAPPRPRKNYSFLIFPGIFQLARGQKAKATALLAGEIAALSGLAIAHIGTVAAHDAYLKARPPTEIESTFRTYQTWFWVRTGCAATALGFYLANGIDGILYRPPLNKTGFYVRPLPDGVACGYAF